MRYILAVLMLLMTTWPVSAQEEYESCPPVDCPPGEICAPVCPQATPENEAGAQVGDAPEPRWQVSLPVVIR